MSGARGERKKGERGQRFIHPPRKKIKKKTELVPLQRRADMQRCQHKHRLDHATEK